MRVFWIYLRGRRIGAQLAAVGGLTVVFLVLGRHSVSIPSLRSTDHLQLPIATLIPLVLAIVLTYAIAPHDAETEASWAFCQRGFRLALILLNALIGLAAVSLLVLTPAGYAFNQAARNLFGNFGLALITAVFAGAGASWTVPVIFSLAATLLARSPTGQLAPWAWPVQAGDDPRALAIAAVLFTCGVTLMVVRGPARELNGDQI
jgi:hypothetical protein